MQKSPLLFITNNKGDLPVSFQTFICLLSVFYHADGRTGWKRGIPPEPFR
jgi:hypothetical protein